MAAGNSPAAVSGQSSGLSRSARNKRTALRQYEEAVRLREALETRPQSDRKEHQYWRIIEAYRAVYHTAPTSSKAHLSVLAVADLLAEAGRKFNDPKSLEDALGQYEFLRREYPGSSFRAEALFAIAEINKNDLDNSAAARTAFREFLKLYPRHNLAEQAGQQLAELEQTSRPRPEQPRKPEISTTAARPTQQVRVTGIRHWSTPDSTRVAIDLQDDIAFETGRIENPERIYFDLKNTRVASSLLGKAIEVQDPLLQKIRIAQFTPGEARVVLDVAVDADYTAFLLPNPSRLMVEIHPKSASGSARVDPASEKPAVIPAPEITAAASPVQSPKSAGPKAATFSNSGPSSAKPDVLKLDDSSPDAANPDTSRVENAKLEAPKLDASKPAAPASAKAAVKASAKSSVQSFPKVHQAGPTATGERSLVRALGLKIGRIVVDAGHGGHDTGTVSDNGLQEKDLVLDVSLRLGKLLESLGADVVYTRDDDTFVPLEMRTAIANQKEADLFISVHANSSPDPSARGVETYYLNFTSSEDALDVAARENAVSEKSIHELQDLVKKITLKDKIEESREFATQVQRSLQNGLFARTSIRDRGVRKAPFIVLIGANMPSILAEISFVSNPLDARRMKTAAYRQKIAESLYHGISRYVSGLSGINVVAKDTRAQTD
jgi:N-acetylmuramoyl-L-alanine amidase